MRVPRRERRLLSRTLSLGRRRPLRFTARTPRWRACLEVWQPHHGSDVISVTCALKAYVAEADLPYKVVGHSDKGPGTRLLLSLFSMIRAVLICAFAAYASTVSAAPVLAPHAGDGLDARLAQLEAKVKALEVGVDTDAKKVSEKSFGGALMTPGSFAMQAAGSSLG